MSLSKLLAREQRAFLHRSRGPWGPHLAKARAFFGEGLKGADSGRPVLILGAGSGLELPWGLAPKNTVGWDADPWSRWRTCLRHQRFPEWVFDDFTGGIAELEATARRTLMLPTGRSRPTERALQRLAGLLPSLKPVPRSLTEWVALRRPGTIVVANVLGQIGSVAQRTLESTFGGAEAWAAHVEPTDPLAVEVEAWIRRVLEAFLKCLRESGAEVWMIHDRAVIWGHSSITLGPPRDPWLDQIQSQVALEVSDPLCGIDVRANFLGKHELRFDRWLWPVGTGQLHMMEALAYSS